ncbi:protein decapping 5-like isoform X2 [Ananas comosus]|uniref:Protein decapping 5-like isoform X2 n=1 Tax=Ananas comosus TaxID=4615 RepID=A0A6P5F5W3_ANACO|nr:protein decapping 5-like isoform X2 [Ananas comosus]
MAAEAGRSGAPSVESYIGSLISLTSKSEIRYEGILFNINTEESSIGLRNVQLFGTEGRKKDGQQIPASDKIYEYILFRGTDIKDLQVKSSPAPAPAQATSVHNDPAIIQSHYSHTTSTTSTLPSITTGNITDLNSHTVPLGLQRPTFQASFPPYQPGGGLAPPMYWQGYYAPSNAPPHLQQPPSLLRPPPGLPLQYPTMNASLPSLPNLSSQNLPEFPPSLLQPSLSTATTSQSQTSTMLPPTTSPNNTLPNVPLKPLTPNVENDVTISPSAPSIVSNKPVAVPGPVLAYQTVPKLVPGMSVSSSSGVQVETSVPLAMLGQLLQTGASIQDQLLQTGPSNPGQPSQTAPTTLGQPLQTAPSTVASSPPLQAPKEKEAKPLETKSKPLLPEPSEHTSRETREPLLPPPEPTPQKINGAVSYPQYNNRGRGRGRGTGYSRPVTNFTEDFDFTAMNEKFKKDEVWGHLGKNKAQLRDTDGELGEDEDDAALDYDEAEAIKSEPVYVKDDFFDSLSCGSMDRGARNGRTRFSEQLRIDTETFGDFPRHRPMRGGGGRGYRGGGGGRAQGFYGRRGYGYMGRGYGYMGRGRGHYFPNHDS